MPLIVIVLPAKPAVTPDGKPVAAPIPVAPVVVWVIFVSTVLIHNAGVDEGEPAVLFGFTVTVAELEIIVPEQPVG